MTSRNLEELFSEGFKQARESGQRPCFGWYEPRYLAGQVAVRHTAGEKPVQHDDEEEEDNAAEQDTQMNDLGELYDILHPSALTSSCFFPSPAVLLEAGVLGSHGTASRASASTATAPTTADRTQQVLRVREAGQTARAFFRWSAPSTAEELFHSGGVGAGAGGLAEGLGEGKVPPARDYERLLLDQ